jgi:phosphohistidine phosphatase
LQAALASGQEAAPSGFHIPGEYSLAYRLITGWLGGAGGSSSSSSNGSSNGRSEGGGSSSWVGDKVPQVDIDAGVFKYVLLRLSDPRDSSRSKLLVRGHAAAAYHNHILQATKAEVQRLTPEGQQQHLDVQVLGGGRIEHYPDQGVVSVYGYSAAFGPAVHEVAAGLVKKWMPFHNVTWSYEGY